MSLRWAIPGSTTNTWISAGCPPITETRLRPKTSSDGCSGGPELQKSKGESKHEAARQTSGLCPVPSLADCSQCETTSEECRAGDSSLHNASHKGSGISLASREYP